MATRSRNLIVRPDATIAAGGWGLTGGAANHQTALDDPISQPTDASSSGDGQGVSLIGASGILRLGLGSPAVPVGEYPSRLRLWAYIGGGGTLAPSIGIDRGTDGDVVGSGPLAIVGGWDVLDVALNVGAIADPNALRLFLAADATGGGVCVVLAAYVELELAYRNPARSVV